MLVEALGVATVTCCDGMKRGCETDGLDVRAGVDMHFEGFPFPEGNAELLAGVLKV